MPHYPINHPLRGLYRGLAIITGAVLVGWAVAGLIATSGQPAFSDEGAVVAGLPANQAFALLAGLCGLVALVSAVLARRRQHFLIEGSGAVLIVLGLVGLTLPHVFAITVAGCVAAFLAGTLLMLCGMYVKPGTERQARDEEIYRHRSPGRVAEPVKHLNGTDRG